ncbi:hypothetical protein LINPERHAP2_LOCUS32877 [Linum perenne]
MAWKRPNSRSSNDGIGTSRSLTRTGLVIMRQITSPVSVTATLMVATLFLYLIVILFIIYVVTV